MKRKPSAALLRQELAANHALAVRVGQDDFPLQTLEHVQLFQRNRLADSYADLSAQERYRPATEFFLGELYGGLHFRERDQQVEAVMPIMVRMLPDNMLAAMADAFRLQELSLELDIQLTHALEQTGAAELDTDLYGEIYRTIPRESREEQIHLINTLGLEISELVKKRLVMMLSRAMRGPAYAAGFGALQQFLENGLHAFRIMRGSEDFMEAIVERETSVMNRLYAGDAEPFKTYSQSTR